MEFSRGRAESRRTKIMEIPGGGRSSVKPTGTENTGGWGVKRGKTLCGGGGVWILSGTTQCASQLSTRTDGCVLKSVFVQVIVPRFFDK